MGQAYPNKFYLQPEWKALTENIFEKQANGAELLTPIYLW